MIKILSLFSGIGAFEKALTNLGLPHEVVNYCEIDPHASKAYSVIHGVSEDKNLRDVTAVDTSKLPDDLDLVTYGFPCVPAGYMVRTFLGYKSIEEIRLHDTVLTHTNTYHEVVKTMSRVSDHINHIKAVGTWDLQVTDEHPLYVLRNGRFKWVKAKDLSIDDRLTFNINTDAFPADISDDILWFMGRYFADGYKEKRKPHRVIFCIGKHKEEEFRQHINGISFTVSHKDRSSVEYRLTDKKVMTLFEYFSTGSSVKEIPRWIVDLPKEQLLHFFNGYYSGDGYTKKGGMKTFGTVSLKMFLSLQEIVIKLFNVVPTVYVRKDGRKESYHDSYCAQFSLHPKDQKVIKDKICVKIKNIHREVKSIDVYNFEVKDDNSYTVNNVIVHNCQDISVAGKQRGFENEEGGYTRSGLFYEALRIIKDTQPRVAIAENVKALTSNKFKKEFNSVLSSLTNIGYMNFWAVLNAKDFGIPQNRERVFIVSVRNDIDSFGFQFPRPVELKLRLKDMLEDNVDEKYYLKGERVDKFLEELRLSGYESKCLRYERTEYAKQIRKEYEAGIIDERRSNLRQYGTRDDGVSNTITTVQKDNYIAEPNIKTVGNLDGHETGRVIDADGITQSLKGTDYKNPVKIALKQVGEIGPHQTDRVYDPDGISRALKSTDYTHPVNIVDAEIERLGNIYEVTPESGKADGDVFGINGVSSALTCKHPFKIAEVKQIGNLLPEAKFNNTQPGRVYDPDGCCPTINTMQGGSREPKILQVGQLLPEDKVRSPQAGRVYSSEGLYGTITTMHGGNLMPKILTDEPAIAAMRGRNPDNPGDRRPGIPTEQRLEINTSGTSNTITTVQKDNYVIEPKNTGCKALGNIGTGGARGRVYDDEGCMCTLMATQYKDPHKVMHQYRIRKLTPKECWRLMGFDDADFDKVKESGISNSQLYKQAGNSIVVQVLEALFRQVKEFF